MTTKDKQRVYELVKVICGTTTILPEVAKCIEDPTPDVPTDNTFLAAKELLKVAGVSPVAVITEIPLCWDDQVGIRFSLGKWNAEKNRVFFDLYAGVNECDQTKFFFELYVENDDGHFPVHSDDDIGIHLLSDVWAVKDDKIVG